MKVAMLKKAMEEVRKEDLLALAKESGAVLLNGLRTLEVSDMGRVVHTASVLEGRAGSFYKLV